MSVSQSVVAAMRASGNEFVKLEELQQAISKHLAPLFGSQRVRIVSSSHAAELLVSAVFLQGSSQYALSTLPESASNLSICLLPDETDIPIFPITLTGCQVQYKQPDADDLFIVSEKLYSPLTKQKKLAIFVNEPVSPSRIKALCQSADAVIFDGRIFRAPRQSAIIASSEVIDLGLMQIAAPRHGVGRSFKTGKEEIAGAYVAALDYFGGGLNHGNG